MKVIRIECELDNQFGFGQILIVTWQILPPNAISGETRSKL